MNVPETSPNAVMPPAPPSVAPARRGRNVHLVCALAVAALHLLWVSSHLAPAIMSPDANGYVVQARLIAEEGRTSFATTSPVQFVGMHWLETETGTFHSRYPAGLPVLFALAWKLQGLDAALFINPLLASATILLTFLLGRRIAGSAYALAAAATVALVPSSNQHALDADAHIAATFFIVAGVLALLRFNDSRRARWGLLAGLLLGVVPTIRYPEAVVGLTVGAWLVWRTRPLWRVWPALVGAAVPVGALMLHNTVAYGAFWRTGYALTNEQTGFGLGYFVSHALPYLQALSGQGLALMFGFGVAGLAALVVDPRRRAEGVLFSGIVVPLVLVYMAYYFGGGGIGGATGNLRFLIPTFPFFAIAGVWLLEQVVARLGTAGRAAAIAAVSLQMLVGFGSSAEVLARAKSSLRAAARARGVAEKEIPHGSVVIVDRQLAESLDATGRWKLVEENFIAGGVPAVGPGLGPGGGRGGPGVFRGPAGEPSREMANQPSPQQRGKNRAQQERFAGLRPDERRALAWNDLKAWAGDKPVFWFARSLDAVDTALPAGADYRNIAELEAPTMLGPGGGPAGPGGIGGPGGPGSGPVMMPGRGGRGGFGPAAGGGGPGFPGRGNFSANTPPKLRVVRIEWAGTAQ